ncbi:CpsD/CapB family tyrosine-protein kinase [Wukongibacter sp. M2B1]|uniref:CpsD/CapB family tyrosine-protein kinase n=1 Tax=Wukongibacter sp. M2B1 TaxID=3088895 RepID=UPI003D7BA1C7
MSLNKLISLNNPKSLISEAYRTLRTNVQFSGVDKNIKSIAITSFNAEEGKTTTISNLAIMMARADKRVLLIDADLRRPKIHEYFEMNNISGLTNALILNQPLKSIRKKSKVKGLDILTSGPKPPNPSEILDSNAMKILISQAEEEYDRILLDSPPIGAVTDPAILSVIVDGTILVINHGKTSIDEAKRAKLLLENVNANILGVVLNKIPKNSKGYYNNYYHQNYYAEGKC